MATKEETDWKEGRNRLEGRKEPNEGRNRWKEGARWKEGRKRWKDGMDLVVLSFHANLDVNNASAQECHNYYE